jgi:hypothetical protein
MQNKARIGPCYRKSVFLVEPEGCSAAVMFWGLSVSNVFKHILAFLGPRTQLRLISQLAAGDKHLSSSNHMLAGLTAFWCPLVTFAPDVQLLLTSRSRSKIMEVA